MPITSRIWIPLEHTAGKVQIDPVHFATFVPDPELQKGGAPVVKISLGIARDAA
jgi:hypothetical protein